MSTSPPTTPPTTPQPWYVVLEQGLQQPNPEDRYDAVARLLGLPIFSDLPRGGHVAGWEVRDW